ncbi:magnesium transporter [Orenia metallireducens]|uniref:Magnesium transporter MgtE n=2 Tax=Orenia metallireducens TaxID=1413210 RepID=A0A1C0AB09_9FIRM|nr:magnesium transporter [Orenia metallireducens]OCL27528.1 magnesium transporter [Orenia metallireducens]PRX25279.1 magnesium transporter [Orenia metallireducens]SNY27095.1 magnesium transporter [Orenia metallireducens]
MIKISDKLCNELIGELKKDNKGLHSWLETIHPIDLAETITDLNDDELLQFYKRVDTELMAEVLEQAEDDFQARFLRLLDIKDIISIFNYMATDDITDIIGNLTFAESKKILNMMKEEDSGAIRKLLGYDEESAGGLMTTEFIALKESLTTIEALTKIKRISPTTEVIRSIFVLDDSKKLVGVADLRDILVAKEETLLRDIANTNVISVTPDIDQEEVALLVAKYDLTAIPVISRKGIMLGIITVDDIIDVIEEENTEDILKLGGVSEEERIDSSLMISIRRRLPWLLINLVTAFLAAYTVGLFEDVIAQVVALAAAMPIVAGMGGNAGTQTLSITIRSIALGELELKESWKIVFKEILLGLIHGAATGVVTGVILYFVYGNPYLGLIILLAMICNLIIAGLSGFLIPLGLKIVGIDPALASAIILTTATDVFGFFIFLGLAKVFLNFLIV